MIYSEMVFIFLITVMDDYLHGDGNDECDPHFMVMECALHDIPRDGVLWILISR